MAAAKTAMSSKIVGADSDFFGRIVVDAVTAVRNEDEMTGR
jgi:T-complex protein 1 subunit alpha